MATPVLTTGVTVTTAPAGATTSKKESRTMKHENYEYEYNAGDICPQCDGIFTGQECGCDGGYTEIDNGYDQVYFATCHNCCGTTYKHDSPE